MYTNKSMSLFSLFVLFCVVISEEGCGTNYNTCRGTINQAEGTICMWDTNSGACESVSLTDHAAVCKSITERHQCVNEGYLKCTYDYDDMACGPLGEGEGE